MLGGVGMLGLLALLVDAAVDLVAGGAHGGGVSGERAGKVLTSVPMIAARLVCICCMARARLPIWSVLSTSRGRPVRSPDAMALARWKRRDGWRA